MPLSVSAIRSSATRSSAPGNMLTFGIRWNGESAHDCAYAQPSDRSMPVSRAIQPACSRVV